MSARDQSIPSALHRQMLDRLRLGAWKSSADLKVDFGKTILRTLKTRGWIEVRDNAGAREFRITRAGLAALAAKIPSK